MITDNIKKIRRDLELIRPGLKILGIVKRQPIDRIEQAIEAGIHLLGDNYIQEGQKVRAQLDHSDLLWHFVGRIQTNKIKFLTEYDCVETLSREEEAKKLNEQLVAIKKTLSVFIEVNLGEESSKSGVSESYLGGLVDFVRAQKQLKLEGLMCLPPPLQPVEKRRPFFKKMKRLQAEFNLAQLSMGTSEDYKIAAEEGATQVRLGTCLFGERPGI